MLPLCYHWLTELRIAQCTFCHLSCVIAAAYAPSQLYVILSLTSVTVCIASLQGVLPFLAVDINVLLEWCFLFHLIATVPTLRPCSSSQHASNRIQFAKFATVHSAPFSLLTVPLYTHQPSG